MRESTTSGFRASTSRLKDWTTEGEANISKIWVQRGYTCVCAWTSRFGKNIFLNRPLSTTPSSPVCDGLTEAARRFRIYYARYIRGRLRLLTVTCILCIRSVATRGSRAAGECGWRKGRRRRRRRKGNGGNDENGRKGGEKSCWAKGAPPRRGIRGE